jgi:hypothetical protein
VLQVNLDRDTSKPLFGASRRSQWYGEVALAGLIAPSLGGGADRNCNCDERRIPLGAWGALRLGYSPVAGWGLELSGGYLSIAEHMTRRMTANTLKDGDFSSRDYEDSTRLRGPLAAVGVSYRMFEKVPVTGRVAFGLAWLSSKTSNEGTYAGEVANPNDESETLPVVARASAAETSERLLAPFASAEVRVGYRISKNFSADFGLGLMLLWPPSKVRAGATNLSDERVAPLDDPDDTWRDGKDVRDVLLELPREDVAGAIVAFSPQLGARWEF